MPTSVVDDGVNKIGQLAEVHVVFACRSMPVGFVIAHRGRRNRESVWSVDIPEENAGHVRYRGMRSCIRPPSEDKFASIPCGPSETTSSSHLQCGPIDRRSTTLPRWRNGAGLEEDEEP